MADFADGKNYLRCKVALHPSCSENECSDVLQFLFKSASDNQSRWFASKKQFRLSQFFTSLVIQRETFNCTQDELDQVIVREAIKANLKAVITDCFNDKLIDEEVKKYELEKLKVIQVVYEGAAQADHAP